MIELWLGWQKGKGPSQLLYIKVLGTIWVDFRRCWKDTGNLAVENLEPAQCPIYDNHKSGRGPLETFWRLLWDWTSVSHHSHCNHKELGERYSGICHPFVRPQHLNFVMAQLVGLNQFLHSRQVVFLMLDQVVDNSSFSVVRAPQVTWKILQLRVLVGSLTPQWHKIYFRNHLLMISKFFPQPDSLTLVMHSYRVGWPPILS